MRRLLAHMRRLHGRRHERRLFGESPEPEDEGDEREEDQHAGADHDCRITQCWRRGIGRHVLHHLIHVPVLANAAARESHESHQPRERDREDEERVLLDRLRSRAQKLGAGPAFTANTPYVNTIPVEKQGVFPGDQEIERRIKSLIRWNALAMVVRANRVDHSIGGHISTYASAATLFEIGFNHFFRGRTDEFEGDTVYLQGHASPGVYSR